MDMTKAVKTKLPGNAVEALAITMAHVLEARAAQPVVRLTPRGGYPFKMAKDFCQSTMQEERMKKLACPDKHREEVELAALQWIGKQLYAAGGTDLMHEALYAAIELNPKYESRMLSICDARWDGIGDWHS